MVWRQAHAEARRFRSGGLKGVAYVCEGRGLSRGKVCVFGTFVLVAKQGLSMEKRAVLRGIMLILRRMLLRSNIVLVPELVS
jgi:hypothetical protein